MEQASGISKVSEKPPEQAGISKETVPDKPMDQGPEVTKVTETMSPSGVQTTTDIHAGAAYANKGTMTSFSDSELLRNVVSHKNAPMHFPIDAPVKTSSAGLPESMRVTVEWRNLTCTLPLNKSLFQRMDDSTAKPPRRRTALRSMTGCARPGDLIAILGPPNSGKSTLIKVLSGFCRQGYTGDVLVNGTVINADDIGRRSSWVAETDMHMDCFTVKETLWIAAELKYPTITERKEKFKAVVNVMERWGLMDIRRVSVERVNKTHRRLLTCAEQFINPQPIIFADDPTRYLDSSQARSCFGNLKYLAYRGHTVIAAISNPNLGMLKYVTKVYVLAEGRVVYQGPPQDIKDALAAHGFICPSELPIIEYLLQVTAKMHGGLRALAETETVKAKQFLEAQMNAENDPVVVKVENNFDDNEGESQKEGQPADNGKKKKKKKRPSVTTIGEGWYDEDSRDYLALLFNRFIFFSFRSSVYMSYRQFLNISLIVLFANIFKSVGFDHTYVNMNVSFLCLYIACVSMASLLNATVKTPRLIRHVVREQRYAMYSKRVYFLARVCSELTYELMFAVSSGIFTYYLTHQPKEENRIFYFLVLAFEVAVLNQALGMLIGTTIESHQMAVMVAVTVYIYSFVFCGYFFSTSDLAVHIRWMPYTSYMHYAFNGAMACIYGLNRKELSCPEDSDRNCTYSTGKSVLEAYSISEFEFYIDISILPCCIVALWVAGYLVLSFRIKWRF
ncbi:ATP-binding cassette sub-family G member 4-like isoform X2 [Ornithodoros turicata]